MPDLPADPLLDESTWHEFEWDAWPLGESIRLAFVKKPPLKRSFPTLEKITEVAICKNLRKGRQSFIMALGYVAARPLADRLITDLHDPDVNGHIVDTLLKMKAPGFGRHIQPLLADERAWVRRLSRRYLTRYPLP